MSAGTEPNGGFVVSLSSACSTFRPGRGKRSQSVVDEANENQRELGRLAPVGAASPLLRLHRPHSFFLRHRADIVRYDLQPLVAGGVLNRTAVTVVLNQKV